MLNLLNLKGEIFNIPFTFNFIKHDDEKKYEKINFKSKLLKLNIINELVEEKDKSINGKNSISFFNSIINTKYHIKEKLIIFLSDK